MVNPTVITGVQVERNREKRWLKLHQGAYTAKLLQDQGMQDCKPVSTPLDPATFRALMLLPVDVVDVEAQKEYATLIGGLIWVIRTRPDMAFTVNVGCRFLKCATKEHLTLMRGRPLRYLRGTINYGIVFCPGSSKWELSGAGDADLAGDLLTSRSTSGGYCKLGEYGAVSVVCSLERKISTSTGQAETYALVSLVKEVIWVRHLLRELGFGQDSPTVLRTDNAGVFNQSTKAINHTMAKHYRISQAYIRQQVEGTCGSSRGE